MVFMLCVASCDPNVDTYVKLSEIGVIVEFDVWNESGVFDVVRMYVSNGIDSVLSVYCRESISKRRAFDPFYTLPHRQLLCTSQPCITAIMFYSNDSG